MMLPTHALVGMLLALPVAFTIPEFAAIPLVAGFLGGVFPDLDMYAGHRRTLHYPVYYWMAAGASGAAIALVFSPVTVAAAVFFLAAATHSASDILGGGLELGPWEGTSQRAVYDHHRGRWIAPRYWIRYDGSPGDLLCSVSIAIPLLVVLEPPYSWVVVGTLSVAVVYVAIRRVLPTIAERLVSTLPTWITAYLPARYRSGA